MGTTTKQLAKADWSMAPRGTVSATIQSSAAIVAAAAVGDLAHVNPVVGLAAASVGALGHLVVGAYRHYAPGALLYRVGCWAGAGGWLTWTLAEHPHDWWNVNGLTVLAVGAVGGGVMAEISSRTRESSSGGIGSRGPSRALVLRSAARTEQDWEARFRRVCRVNVEVTDIRSWPTGAGYDVFGKLPPGGATLKQLQAATDALATDADLPDGCGVEIKSTGTRASFVAHVSTVNRLQETIDYPEDFTPLSIYDLLRLGEHRNSDLAAIVLRENSAVVVGQKRSGKTNVLNVITVGVGRCVDALAWHIDMNGGGISQAWLHPWLQGKTGRPAVDWAASTPIEALFMTTVALAIAKYRKSAYREFKVASDSNLLQLSADLPAIEIIVDESAESMGIGANKDPILRQVRDNLEEIQRIGGNEGINVIPSALRATQDMISPAVIKQSRIRIGMLVQDTEELAYLFGWQHRDAIDPADLSGQGSGFLSVGADTPRPFKANRMTPSQVTRAAIAIADQRSDLDQASAGAGDAEFVVDLGGIKPVRVSGLYSRRYERMRAAFTGNSDTQADLTEDAAPAPAPPPTAAPAPTPTTPAAPVRLVSANDWPDLTDRVAQAAARPHLIDANDWPDLSNPTPAARTGATADASVAPAGELSAPAQQQVPELIRRALESFDVARDDRLHTETLAAALGIAPHAMAELLRDVGIRSLPNAFSRGGVEKRGYARVDFASVADKIACGELQVPPALAAWSTAA